MTLRLGLIGIGRWGRNYVTTLRQMPGIVLARAASSNPASAELVGPGCVLHRDWREVARATDLDGVIIATPPRLHAEMAIAALEAGKAVLVEKPLTMDVAEAESIRAAARRADRPVLVEHTQLFNPPFRALVEASRALGPVRSIRSEAGGQGPYRNDVPVLWDWGAHDVAMCLTVLGGEPDSIAVCRSRFEPRPDGAMESLGLSLRFQGGVVAELRLSNCVDKCRRFVVEHDQAVLLFDDWAEAKLTRHSPGVAWPEAGDGTPLPWIGERPLTEAIQRFATALATGDTESEGVDLGCKVVRVLARCQQVLVEA
ncbi:hypothetical protein WV31_12885 [Magnetospirillum sp. ME-1]|uniref:Gfo/Idh/MocA family protein n=1 Tax=Magnetospirillum sp. ME-1 TaxID=1639348 RepID=UPI000A17B813|nr:Gfo/Idh/MocA family oxidoreductase [Magnetospirillum sp. ME-1]ARJ66500.1 hypothetical protein WV31_12885 [Magnetospirillum sp. ME-1]